MFLLVFGFKMLSPVVALKVNLKAATQITATTENDEEKKSETENSSETVKEFITLNNHYTDNVLYRTLSTYYTAYLIHYKQAYTQQVTIPPPDAFITPLA